MTIEQLIIKIKDINQEIMRYNKLLDDAPSPKKFAESTKFLELEFSGELVKVPVTYDVIINLLYKKIEDLRSELKYNEKLLLNLLK